MKRPTLVAAVLLVALTVAVFLPVIHFDFVHWDDDDYVIANPRVQAGVTVDNVVWAFTTIHFGYYYPLTWISHMLDCSLYGLQAGGHHATSLVIHVANALLLLAALHRMTGAVWRSALVAALFGIHPQHVESVAWIAERKDVLSTLFCLLAILAYERYAKAPSSARYLTIVLFFALGLLVKPMIVTLPALLLLLDYWPLSRWPSAQPGTARRLILEKIPLFAAVPLFGVVTYVAQAKINAVVTAIPLAQRAANAAIACAGYIVKMFAPVHLSAFYTHPRGGVSYPLAVGAGAALALATALALRFGKQRRYLAVGWLWYVVALAPVLGLIQVGDQASADRYTYFAFTGLFIIIAWGLADLVGALPRLQTVVAAAAVVAILALATVARAQVGMWQNSATLFTAMTRLSPDAAVGHYDLGKVLDEQGKLDEAVASYRRAIELDPRREKAWTNLGIDLHNLGKKNEALSAFLRADELQPNDASTKFNIGLAHEFLEQYREALTSYKEAIALEPALGAAQGKLSPAALGIVYEKAVMWPEAKDAFEQATKQTPADPKAWAFLGLAYQNLHRLDEAAASYREAIRIEPGMKFCRYNLGVLALKAGDEAGAREQLEALQGLDGELAANLANLIQGSGGNARGPAAR